MINMRNILRNVGEPQGNSKKQAADVIITRRPTRNSKPKSNQIQNQLSLEEHKNVSFSQQLESVQIIQRGGKRKSPWEKKIEGQMELTELKEKFMEIGEEMEEKYEEMEQRQISRKFSLNYRMKQLDYPDLKDGFKEIEASYQKFHQKTASDSRYHFNLCKVHYQTLVEAFSTQPYNDDSDMRRLSHLKDRLDDIKNRMNDIQYMSLKQKPQKVNKDRRQHELIRECKVKNQKWLRRKKKTNDNFITVCQNALFLKDCSDSMTTLKFRLREAKKLSKQNKSLFVRNEKMKQSLFNMTEVNYLKLGYFIKYHGRQELLKLQELFKKLKYRDEVIQRSYRNVSEYQDIVSFMENAQETKYLRIPTERFLENLKKDNSKIDDTIEEREQKKFILQQKLQNLEYINQREKDKRRNQISEIKRSAIRLRDEVMEAQEIIEQLEKEDQKLDQSESESEQETTLDSKEKKIQKKEEEREKHKTPQRKETQSQRKYEESSSREQVLDNIFSWRSKGGKLIEKNCKHCLKPIQKTIDSIYCMHCKGDTHDGCFQNFHSNS